MRFINFNWLDWRLCLAIGVVSALVLGLATNSTLWNSNIARMRKVLRQGPVAIPLSSLPLRSKIVARLSPYQSTPHRGRQFSPTLMDSMCEWPLLTFPNSGHRSFHELFRCFTWSYILGMSMAVYSALYIIIWKVSRSVFSSNGDFLIQSIDPCGSGPDWDSFSVWKLNLYPQIFQTL